MTDTGLIAYASLGSDTNKRKSEQTLDTKQGVVSEKLPELTLEMQDSDIVDLTTKWKKIWDESDVKATWLKQIEENENYWLGKQFDMPSGDKTRPMVDNIIFEAVETYLPQATRRNPDPMVALDSSEEADPVKEKYVEKVKTRLSNIADRNKLRLKLKKGARHWMIYQLGVAKFGWDVDKNIPMVRIIRPKKIILDPEASIDEDGYNGEYIGELRRLPVSKIEAAVGDEMTPDAKKKLDELTKEKKGTSVAFIEWWTNEYMCWTLDKTVLLKKKNPHWNYDSQVEEVNVDDYGNEVPAMKETVGVNHFPVPQMPYAFLSIFNLGDQPVDKTSLIGQNLSNQDKINKRDKQIDKNADRMNGGMVVSLGRSGLTQAQAKNVSESLRKGGVVAIPDGSPRDAIDQYSPSGLPVDVYNDRNDTRDRLRDIFGVRGSSVAGLNTEKTVRGKVMNRGTDTDRIGGGVTEYLEQWADDWYNWITQLLYVYDAGFQFIGNAVPPKLQISVKEGSLLPKDSVTIANQALELAAMNRISNIDLYKRLEYPNPEELAANVWLEANAPQLLFKDNPLVMEAIQMQQQAAMAAEAAKMEEGNARFEEDTAKERMKHENDMEKEMLRGKMKQEGAQPLSEVPMDGTMG